MWGVVRGAEIIEFTMTVSIYIRWEGFKSTDIGNLKLIQSFENRETTRIDINLKPKSEIPTEIELLLKKGLNPWGPV